MPELSPLYHSARAKGRTEDQLRSSNLSRTECTCGLSPFGRSAQSSCNSRPDCLLCPSERRFTISLPPAFSTLAQRVRETLTLTGRKKPPSKEPRRIISLSTTRARSSHFWRQSRAGFVKSLWESQRQTHSGLRLGLKRG